MARMDRTVDIAFDVDLGELVPGHHVIARGIDRGAVIEVEPVAS